MSMEPWERFRLHEARVHEAVPVSGVISRQAIKQALRADNTTLRLALARLEADGKVQRVKLTKGGRGKGQPEHFYRRCVK